MCKHVLSLLSLSPPPFISALYFIIEQRTELPVPYGSFLLAIYFIKMITFNVFV